MDIIKVDCGKTRLVSDGGPNVLEADNTYFAFLASCNRMYYGIKCDVRFTKDRRIVTSRYRNLSAISDDPSRICMLKLDELLNIPLKNNSRNFIPTLNEVIQLSEKYHKILCIELHQPIGCKELEILKNEIYQAKNISYIKIISNDVKILRLIRKDNFQIMLELKAKEFSDQIFLDASKYHFDISLPLLKISSDLVELCHENRIKVSTYNVNDPINALVSAELGVDYIYTSSLEEYRPN